jgi:hypothetical protein
MRRVMGAASKHGAALVSQLDKDSVLKAVMLRLQVGKQVLDCLEMFKIIFLFMICCRQIQLYKFGHY